MSVSFICKSSNVDWILESGIDNNLTSPSEIPCYSTQYKFMFGLCNPNLLFVM